MSENLKRYFILFSLFVLPLYSQFKVVKEELSGSRYILTYRNDGSQGQSGLITDDSVDLFSTSCNLFIAIPPSSTPQVKYKVINRQPAPAKYSITTYNISIPEYSVKGFLWIENSYCIHIEVHPFQYSAAAGLIVELKEFQIELQIPSVNNTATLEKKNSLPSAIDNILYGVQWEAEHPTYAIAATDEWINYSYDYLKIGVANDGIYRIQKDDLISYGVPAGSLNPKKLKIYLKGKEIPIYVKGENDDSFDDDDFIEFLGRRKYGDSRYRQVNPYGTSYYEYLDSYSDTTMYWLNWDGSDGLRTDTILITSGIPSDTIHYYDELIHKEINLYWDFSLNPGGLSAELRKNLPELLENETWHEGNLNVGSVPIQFTISNLYPNKPARAIVKLQDFASNIQTNAHNLGLSINTRYPAYDSGFINKYQVKVLSGNFLSSKLVNGLNTVTIHSFATASNPNTVIRDWYELEYPRYLSTTTDSLSFGYRNLGSPLFSMIVVSGMYDSIFSLYKFNLSDSTILKITNYTYTNDTVYFVDTIKADTYYFLLADSKIPSPIIFYKKRFTNLRSSNNKADYIAITHPYFQSVAANYVSFISSTYGVTTKLVDIFDICDEFNYGFWAPEPIREFLKSTHMYWQTPAPKHVLLLGKGTYDYYGNKYKYAGVPRVPNFVPPLGNPVSDNLLVMWDTTNAVIPQMNIGRLPVKTIDEFQAYFSKHQKYVSKGYDEWNKRYLFFSGGNYANPSDSSQVRQLRLINEDIINDYASPPPVGGKIANFYKTTVPITNFGPYSDEYVKGAIEQGGVFISYIGHSGTDTWDNSITSITQLENIHDRSPMISDFGCSTGKHAEPDILSFSEKAVSAIEGQAISYIGNSSLGFTSTAYSFPNLFYKKLLVDTSASLGEIHRLAKIDFIKQSGSSESYKLFLKTNSLIGDPIVTLPIPTKPNFSFTNSIIKIFPDRPTEETDSIVLSVSYFNFGSVDLNTVDITMKTEFQGSVVFTDTVTREIPLFSDSVVFTIPVKGKPGSYTITVTIDPINKHDEIYENDNSITYNVLVASTSIRTLTTSTILNQTNGTIVFLNPSVKPSQNNFYVDVSLNKSFEPKTVYTVLYDTFFTKFILDPMYYGKRVWVRSKIDETSLEGLSYSYVYGDKNNFLLQDSVALNELSLNGLTLEHQDIFIDSSKVIFTIESGGFNDGNTALIAKNNQNYVPSGQLGGFHVCIFNAETYDFVSYYLFRIQSNPSASANFTSLLDTLPSNYLVMIAISNDVASNGSLFTTSLKTAIKQYGSIFIDSIKIADSWALIGRKGATPGTVPEKFRKRSYDGQTISIDTTVLIPDLSGSFRTPDFGPVLKWKDIEIKYHSQSVDDINISVLGTKVGGETDTLWKSFLTDSVISLAAVNTNMYPNIHIEGELNRAEGNISPVISSFAVNYEPFPEVGTNYQAIKGYLLLNGTVVKEITSVDSILQGEKVRLVYRIYNAGGSTVKNVSSLVTSIWENNYTEQLANFTIDSILPLSYKELSVEYNTALGFGKRNFHITIDPDTVIRENYRDNNFFVFPIYVKKNQNVSVLPNLSISQEGISSALTSITDEIDSVLFKIVYQNTGAVVNDSISITIKHLYQNSIVTEWLFKKKYPASVDTLSVTVPILGRTGEHQLQVNLDPVGLILESSEFDNIVTHYFTVSTTIFKIIQPNRFTASSFQKMLFLNPTESASQTNRMALLNLDTNLNFSTEPIQIPMQEFTTTYNINSVAKGKRYYWRIKELGSTRDWTAGTFYLGTDSIYVLGQVDSIGWNNNTFVHTEYISSTGAQIADTKYTIEVMSKGFTAGATGSATINGINIIAPVLGPGHNIAVVDSTNYSIISLKRFDVSNIPSESDSLEQFIISIPAGSVVIDLIVDDGSNNLQQSARNALKTIGSAYIDQVGWRDSWAIIGRKGAAPGTIPEQYQTQSPIGASVDTIVIKKEYFGTITTPLFGVVSGLSNFTMQSTIPNGTELKARLIGYQSTQNVDTIQLFPTSNFAVQSSQSIQSTYSDAKILFELKTTNQSSPIIKSWSFTLAQPTELAVSGTSSFVDRTEAMVGEPIIFSSKIYNLGLASVDSVQIVLKTSHLGIITPLQQLRLPKIPGGDSLEYSYSYNTREKKGDYSFIFEIIPQDSANEINNTNNSITVPFTVLSDSIKPQIRVTFDGREIVNGDYISRYPEVRMQYTDDNLSQLFPSDTNNFKIKLNNEFARFVPGVTELVDIETPGRAEIRWTPVLPKGENFIEFYATDLSGNYSDSIRYFVNVDSVFKLLEVYNIPNPFKGSTHFTFNLAGPISPDEVIIKLYTVAGRLIHEIHSYANIGFNKISWDGRDKDGDEIGNGVYLYKVIVKGQDEQVTETSKLVKMK